MDIRKALLVGSLILIATVWSASFSDIALPGPVEDAVLAVVGVVGLALGSVFRTLGTIAQPLAVLARIAIVPLALAGLSYLIVKELRRPAA